MQMLLSKAKQVLNRTKATNVPEINQIQSVLRQTNIKQQMVNSQLNTVKHKSMHKGASHKAQAQFSMPTKQTQS